MNAKFIIGIGAQKAGTTWLSDYLADHPEVCFSPWKELHYFDTKYVPELCGQMHDGFVARQKKFSIRQEINWILQTGLIGKHALSYRQFLKMRVQMDKDENVYRQYFDKINSGQKYSAEITPSYSLLNREGFSAMKRLLGDVRLIFIMRNPADRFWSNMRHIQGKHDTFDPKAEFKDRLHDDRNVLRTDYIRTMSCVNDIFPKEDVLYLFYEHLFHGENRLEYFNRIPEFLDIKAVRPDLTKSVNRSIKTKLNPEDRRMIVERFESVYRGVVNMFEDVPQSWIDDIGLLKQNN